MAAIHQRLSGLDLNEWFAPSAWPATSHSGSQPCATQLPQLPVLSWALVTLPHHAAASSARDGQRGGRRLQWLSQSNKEELRFSRGRQEVEEELPKTAAIRFAPEMVKNC